MRVKAALVAVLLGLVAATPAAADVYDDNPAAAALGPGNVYVFARAADGTILERNGSASGWSAWAPLPGLAATSGPAAIALGTTLNVFARGPDGAIWQDYLQDGHWSGWITLGGGLTSAPAVALRQGTTTLDLFARGLDNTLQHKTFVGGSGWSSWEALGGNLTAAPAAVGYASVGSTDVFVRDTGGGVTTRYWYNGWSDWTALGGGIVGAPATAFQVPNQLDIFGRWADGGLYTFQFNSTRVWTLVDPTPLGSSPAATSDAAGREYVFAIVGGQLAYKLWTVGATPAWTPWTAIGPVALPVAAPAPVPVPAPVVTATPATIAPVLAFNFHAGKRSTRFTSLSVKTFPKGSTVKVTCPKGCSAKSWTKRDAHGTVSLARFVKKPLKVGTVITVVVSKAGMTAGVKVLKVRAHHTPSVTTRCRPAGATKPQAC
jgi:hypothetical protein